MSCGMSIEVTEGERETSARTGGVFCGGGDKKCVLIGKDVEGLHAILCIVVHSKPDVCPAGPILKKNPEWFSYFKRKCVCGDMKRGPEYLHFLGVALFKVEQLDSCALVDLWLSGMPNVPITVARGVPGSRTLKFLFSGCCIAR